MARAQAFGLQYRTNNQAELAALLAGTEWARSAYRGGIGVVFVGDSRLVVDFCLRVARPKRAALFTILERVLQLWRQLRPKVVVVHVPRRYNKIADWLS